MNTGAKFIKCLCADIQQFRFKKTDIRSWDRQKVSWPFHILTHPFAGISDIKYEQKGSAFIASLVLFFYFISNVLRFFYTGFIFNMNKTDSFNIIMELMSSIIMIVLWTVANWSVSTLMDGEGKFREIWIVSCYAVMPKLLINLLLVLLSNFMVYNENIFLSALDSAGTIWMVALLVIGILIIHQYSLMKTVACCLITVMGIAAILFMAILFISIVQQMFGFVNTVSVELLNRY